MKRRWKTAIILLCVAIPVAIAWLISQPIYCKVLLGTARVLSQQVNVVLTIDGRPVPGVRCFRESTRYDGNPSDRLVLYIDDPNAVLKHHILLVAPAERRVLLPNQSADNYRLIRDEWLIQSNIGDQGVGLGSSKLDGVDPQVERSEGTISFTVSPLLDLPGGRWSLRIDGGT